MENHKTIWVVTAEDLSKTRSPGERRVADKQLEVENLSGNINIFLDQIGDTLEKTPEIVGKFQFVEFEVYAEISVQGQLKLLGTGIEAGTIGGLKFVFRRLPVSS